MIAKTVQIHWHEKQPIFSADFDPTCSTRLATAGGDNNVRIWRVVEEAGETKVHYSATLSRHLKPVNCVRFSPNGQYLASASDGGSVVLWRQGTVASKAPNVFGADQGDDMTDSSDFLESWTAAHMLRASDLEDIYDLAWSPDSRYVLFGLTDHSVQIWDVTSGQKVKVIKEHGHFVQGACWDPLNVFIATQSADRTVKTFKIATRMNGSIHVASFGKIGRAPLPHFGNSDPEDADKFHNLFLDETLVSFFRRLSFSPDGSLLFMPAGSVPAKASEDAKGRHAFYVTARGQLNQLPSVVIDGFAKGVVAVRPHPCLFKHHNEASAAEAMFSLPYRVVYAVASQDSVFIFDSCQANPIMAFNNLHYGTITDLAWSNDGKQLIITATDGFATVVSINEGDLGVMMSSTEQAQVIAEIRQRYAPDASPKPKLVDPLELDMSLSSEPVAPTSEVDRLVTSDDVPMAENEPVQINVLPIKRKVVPSTNLNISTTEMQQ